MAEAMEPLAAGPVFRQWTSKMLRILEEKELIVRTLGEVDRRLMQFHLSQNGKKLVGELELEKVEIPELLKPLFESTD